LGAVAALVITGGPSPIVIASVNCALVPKALEPVRRTFVGPPTTVGVPEITPVAAVSVRPGGSGSRAAWVVKAGPAASVIE
jgi:hypothetical protein